MEILFKGMSKKTGQPVIGYHLKMLNEHGEMVDKIYKNCGYDKEEWGFMEIEPGSLEVFVEGKTLFNSLQEQKDLDLHPINFGDEDDPMMRCPHCNKDVTDLTGWISVDDKLPEDDVDVLIAYADIDDENYTDICITTYGNAYLGGNKLDFKEWRSPFEYFKGNYKVMAWQYLPEPYRPERNNEE